MNAPAPEGCSHLEAAESRSAAVVPSGHGCVECLKAGGVWVHLRLCMTCGHVGCCDNSPNKHATKHFHGTGHPVIRSYEPEEDWGYCYPDELFLEELPARPGEAATRHYEPPTLRTPPENNSGVVSIRAAVDRLTVGSQQGEITCSTCC